MMSKILFAIFLAYIFHSMWSIFSLFNSTPCKGKEECLRPSWDTKSRFQVILCTSIRAHYIAITDLNIVWKANNFDIFQPRDIPLKIELPERTKRNGSLHLHAFFLIQGAKPKTLANLIGHKSTAKGSVPITKHVLPQAASFNLLSSNKANVKPLDPTKIITHWKPKVPLHFVSEPFHIPMNNIPGDVVNFLKLGHNKEYMPILYPNTIATRDKELIPVSSKDTKISLVISYTPISLGRLRLMATMQQAMEALFKLGFTEKDIDDIKGLFFDTSIYLLLLTFFVSSFHLLFDVLAIKNDITFWKNKTSLVGMSFQTLLWRCTSQTIVFFYLWDQNTSFIVLGPSGTQVILELWKVSKALKVKIIRSGWKLKLEWGSKSEEETTTDDYDNQGFKLLLYLLIPLCIGGAVYSLLYLPHKGWWSWTIQCLVNGVYAFGFLFMLPQLFINYKLKSVAHLPWRTFTYKAFNTVVDDLFAFIIHMPTAHRVACFRDDIVFVMYLIQRWMYPVDKSRVNEFGQKFDTPKDDSTQKKIQ